MSRVSYVSWCWINTLMGTQSLHGADCDGVLVATEDLSVTWSFGQHRDRFSLNKVA